MPLRVLHVAQPLDAGVPNVAGDLVADQVARGWDVAAASPEAGDLRGFALRAGARHLRWEAVRAPGPSSAHEAAALARLVGEYEPDLVHLHSAKAGLAGRLAIRGARPTVFQPHSWSFEAARGAQRTAAIRWERFATRWADAVVCVSEDERERGRALGIRAGWAVLPNGVDLERLVPADAAERSAARDAARPRSRADRRARRAASPSRRARSASRGCGRRCARGCPARSSCSSATARGGPSWRTPPAASSRSATGATSATGSPPPTSP